jgi:Predicted metal-binding protein related to the C-terminal domain of SecA
METTEILHQFERHTGKFALAAVEAAVQRQEEVTPELLSALEDAVNRAAQLDAEGDYMAHLYAMFLLAQFRETRAYPLVVRLASLPGDLLDSLCGDFITEDLGAVLASVCGGELTGIQSLIENESTDEWIRGAALGSLVTLVAAGQKSRDQIVSYFAGLFRGKLVREWSHVWDALVSYSSELYAAELLDDIERACEEGLVDPGYIRFDDVKRDVSMGKERVLARLVDNPHRHLVDDTVAEMGWWACFHEGRARKTANAVADSNLNLDVLSTQIRRATPKIGRNEPCPCGSGKKYKKCCGA